jgi:glycosyltransferase involved in cell wall biosynthesis
VASDQWLSSVELRIAGDGELADQVRADIIEFGLGDKVTMLGYVNGDEKLACIDTADIMVVPSIITDDGDAEGFPVTLMEGLAAGKLCIATDVSGADEILVNNENGFLIEARDVSALAQAMQSALTLDETRARKMKARARECAWTFDWQSIARRHHHHLFHLTKPVTENYG